MIQIGTFLLKFPLMFRIFLDFVSGTFPFLFYLNCCIFILPPTEEYLLERLTEKKRRSMDLCIEK